MLFVKVTCVVTVVPQTLDTVAEGHQTIVRPEDVQTVHGRARAHTLYMVLIEA